MCPLSPKRTSSAIMPRWSLLQHTLHIHLFLDQNIEAYETCVCFLQKIRATKTACSSLPPSPNSEPTTKIWKRARWLSSAFRKRHSYNVCLCVAGLFLHSSVDLNQIVSFKMKSSKLHGKSALERCQALLQVETESNTSSFLCFLRLCENSQKKNQSKDCRSHVAF